MCLEASFSRAFFLLVSAWVSCSLVGVECFPSQDAISKQIAELVNVNVYVKCIDTQHTH